MSQIITKNQDQKTIVSRPMSLVEEARAQAEDIALIAEVFGLDAKEKRHMQRAFLFSTVSNGLVPDCYKGDYRSIFIMSQIAEQMGCSLSEVLQGSYFVNGRFAWYTEFMIKRVLLQGVFTTLTYEGGGKAEDNTLWCRAIGTYPDGTQANGTVVTMAMAHAEGWVEKKLSKWKTMPTLMIRKRAAAWLIRESAAHIFGGAPTLSTDEAEDIQKASRQDPELIEAGKTNAMEVMAAMVMKEEKDFEEQHRLDLFDKVEKKIAERIHNGADPVELEKTLGMSLSDVGDQSIERLLAIWDVINA